MLFQEFIEKNNGKYVEVAGSANAKFQCVDAANSYIRDVLGLSIIEWTNAQDFPSKAGTAYDYILNTPDGIPNEGDIVIWRSADNVGHIAVFIEGNLNSFRSFDQNYPLGTPCHVQGHSYANVFGWLRKKKGEVMDNEIIKRADAFVAVCDALGKAVDKDIVLADIERLKKLEDLLRERDRELIYRSDQIIELEGKLKVITEQKTVLEDDNKVLFNQTEQQQRRLTDLTNNLIETSKQIEELKKIQPLPTDGWALIAKGIAKLFGK